MSTYHEVTKTRRIATFTCFVSWCFRGTALLLACVSSSAAPRTQTFTGVITDDMCWKAGHARMGMGSNDAECVKACVAEHGAVYVLQSGRNVYTLDDQKTPERFAAQKVKVAGTLDPKTKAITVESIRK